MKMPRKKVTKKATKLEVDTKGKVEIKGGERFVPKKAKVVVEKPVAEDYKEKDWNKSVPPTDGEVLVAPIPVIFEGNTVLEVLKDGHTEFNLHCRMSNGTTQHVPKKFFN